ncbi:MAG: hypothetical protein J6866_05610 [Victivallales bacterium]|nr:hypothetical protein [Victivallales bacterium]
MPRPPKPTRPPAPDAFERVGCLTLLLRTASIPLLLYLAVVLFLFSAQVATHFQNHAQYRYFLIGLVAGCIIFCTLCQCSTLYVIGHELTHYLVAKLFRKETGRFRIGSREGSVEVSNPNFWIILAPYFVPFWMLLTAGICGLHLFFAGTLSPLTIGVYQFLLGLTAAHHLVLTVNGIYYGQSDLRRCGTFFSLSLILACNALMLALGLLIATGAWKTAPAELGVYFSRTAEWFVQIFHAVRDIRG